MSAAPNLSVVLDDDHEPVLRLTTNHGTGTETLYDVPLRRALSRPDSIPTILPLVDAAWTEVGPVMMMKVRCGWSPYVYGPFADHLVAGLLGACGRRRLALLVAQAMEAGRVDDLLARGRAMSDTWRRRHERWLQATVADTAAKRGDLAALAVMAGAA